MTPVHALVAKCTGLPSVRAINVLHRIVRKSHTLHTLGPIRLKRGHVSEPRVCSHRAKAQLRCRRKYNKAPTWRGEEPRWGVSVGEGRVFAGLQLVGCATVRFDNA